jgi:dihydrodipicolinate synthase/N-acetylneuraminate lyase
MYQHFKAVNDAIGIPIIVYNIPPPLGRRPVGRDHDPAVRA